MAPTLTRQFAPPSLQRIVDAPLFLEVVTCTFASSPSSKQPLSAGTASGAVLEHKISSNLTSAAPRSASSLGADAVYCIRVTDGVTDAYVAEHSPCPSLRNIIDYYNSSGRSSSSSSSSSNSGGCGSLGPFIPPGTKLTISHAYLAHESDVIFVDSHSSVVAEGRVEKLYAAHKARITAAERRLVSTSGAFAQESKGHGHSTGKEVAYSPPPMFVDFGTPFVVPSRRAPPAASAAHQVTMKQPQAAAATADRGDRAQRKKDEAGATTQASEAKKHPEREDRQQGQNQHQQHQQHSAQHPTNPSSDTSARTVGPEPSVDETKRPEPQISNGPVSHTVSHPPVTRTDARALQSKARAAPKLLHTDFALLPRSAPGWMGRFAVLVTDVQMYPPTVTRPKFHVVFTLTENPLLTASSSLSASLQSPGEGPSGGGARGGFAGARGGAGGGSRGIDRTSHGQAVNRAHISARAATHSVTASVGAAATAIGAAGGALRMLALASDDVFSFYIGPQALVKALMTQAAKPALTTTTLTPGNSGPAAGLSGPEQVKARLVALRSLIGKATECDLLVDQPAALAASTPTNVSTQVSTAAANSSSVVKTFTVMGIADSIHLSDANEGDDDDVDAIRDGGKR